jgi:hypothetical protein
MDALTQRGFETQHNLSLGETLVSLPCSSSFVGFGCRRFPPTHDFVVSNHKISAHTKPGQNTLLLSLVNIPTKCSQIMKALGFDPAGEALAG